MTQLKPPTTTNSGQNLKTLAGVIERITFQNEENGYTVARLLPERKDSQSTPNSAKGEDNLVTVVGTLFGVVAGEALELTGYWQNHSQHGWQFSVTNYRSVLPATAQGIRKYLGSGLIKGIGPKTAEKIVAYFDTTTLDILENAPERLGEVPKLGPHKASLIAKAWTEQKAIKEVMVFLQEHGVSTSLAVRIYKQYGDSATTIVKNESYRLAREVWGIGFKTADKIAQALGYQLDDPERVKAGTLFVLSEASDSGGHTYLPRPLLGERAAELLGVSAAQVDTAVSALVFDGGAQIETLSLSQEGSISFEPLTAIRVFTPELAKVAEKGASYQSATAVTTATPTPTTKGVATQKPAPHKLQPILEEVGATPTLSALPGEQAVYLPPFYFAEVGIAKKLLKLARIKPEQDKLAEFKTTDFSRMFDYLATKENLKLADRQEEGVVMALVKPVGVLTGGPGTGKTTSLRALIRVLSLKKKSVILAAPTGRAAKRLSEATGLEAKTLHRLLGIRPGSKAQYDQDTPIPADIVIVDETSMLDTLLMNTLLKAIAPGTHLLLVGDADQLPSVGAGNVLADIINSGVVPVVRLEHIFRQGAGSAITTNAHRINQGQLPITGKNITDFFFFPEDDAEKAGELVVEVVTKRLPEKFSFAPSEIQVLSPMHRGRAGVGYLNDALQAVINPETPAKAQKQFGGRLFREGDKVLQLRNNYEKEVFNGDGGVIRGINHEEQIVRVELEDGRTVEYEFSELDELTLAYAISIHKSQGSEYPVCVIPVVMGHYLLLERKLIYTAITRAKKLVVLVGSKKALAMAVRNGPGSNDSSSEQHRAGRYTGLAIRLEQMA